ncbi:hypothetical protein DFP73DRAFT_634815 [Morchella snyderi]|nr:hypothetical protein DFP73DRAFT_634815 [Morchella snyderi]
METGSEQDRNSGLLTAPARGKQSARTAPETPTHTPAMTTRANKFITLLPRQQSSALAHDSRPRAAAYPRLADPCHPVLLPEREGGRGLAASWAFLRRSLGQWGRVYDLQNPRNRVHMVLLLPAVCIEMSVLSPRYVPGDYDPSAVSDTRLHPRRCGSAGGVVGMLLGMPPAVVECGPATGNVITLATADPGWWASPAPADAAAAGWWRDG